MPVGKIAPRERVERAEQKIPDIAPEIADHGGKGGKLHGGGEGGTRILPAEHRRHDAHMGGRGNRQQFGDALHQAEKGDLGISQADKAGVHALGADVSHVGFRV